MKRALVDYEFEINMDMDICPTLTIFRKTLPYADDE